MRDYNTFIDFDTVAAYDNIARNNATKLKSQPTEKYKPIASMDIVNHFAGYGYGVTSFDVMPNSQHLIRLQKRDSDLSGKTELPQIVALNSYHAKQACGLYAGNIVFACANGIISGADTWSKILHRGKNVTYAIDEAQAQVLNSIDIKSRVIEKAKQIMVNKVQIRDLVNTGLIARYGDKKILEQLPDGTIRYDMPINHIIRPRHYAQNEDNLYNVFNRIQESMTRGGFFVVDKKTGKYRRQSALRDLTKLNKINIDLWENMEHIAA